MRTKINLFVLFLGIAIARAGAQQQIPVNGTKEALAASSSAPRIQRDRLQVPNRPSAALYQGEQGGQKTEVRFDPATKMVTIKMLVQDPNGYFIPNVRRDNFAVYEDGVRQHNATVDVEHAPVSLAVLLEWGGRYQALNNARSDEVLGAARQILDELGRQDKIAIFRYGERVERLADFSAGHDTLDELFTGLGKPEFSELNFYDALVSTANFMKPVTGRKAIILISSGVDTFSKAKYEDALVAARTAGTPIYAINIAPALRRSLELALANPGTYARIDWKRAETQLQDLAKASGGRMYCVDSTLDLPNIYDDLMENLRVRYVITYKSSTTANSDTARTIRIELVDPTTMVR